MTNNSDICFDIEGRNHTILCGSCNTKIAYVGDDKADGTNAGCVDCGNVDDVNKIAEIVSEYAMEELQLAVNRQMRDTARQSKLMTFSGQTVSNKSYRFIVEW